MDDMMRSNKTTDAQETKKANAKMGLRRAIRTLRRERVPKRVREYFEKMKAEAEGVLGSAAQHIHEEMEDVSERARDRPESVGEVTAGSVTANAEGGDTRENASNTTGEPNGATIEGVEDREKGREASTPEESIGEKGLEDANAEEEGSVQEEDAPKENSSSEGNGLNNEKDGEAQGDKSLTEEAEK